MRRELQTQTETRSSRSGIPKDKRLAELVVPAKPMVSPETDRIIDKPT
jgi:hypothetical protein